MGKYGVKFTFATPQYSQLFYLASQFIVPQHIWQSLGDPTKVPNSHPIGTGPYLLTSLSFNNLVLTANPHYWQKGLPCIKTISAPPADSNTTADLKLDQGGGDWGGVFVAQLSKYTGSSPNHKYWFPPVYDASVCTNLKTSPLSSLALRQAISDALNRTDIVDQAELGELLPIKNVTDLVLPRDNGLLDPKYNNVNFPNSVAKAKAVLKAAGYTFSSSGQLKSPSGAPVTFTLQAPAANSDSVAAMEAVDEELKTIGINAPLDDIPNTQWQSNLELGNFQMSICYSQNGPSSFYIYNGFLNSANTAPVGSSATSNYDRFSDPKADSYIQSYLSTNNPAVQLKDMEGLEAIMVSQIPVMPVFYQTDWGEYNTTNITGWPSASDPYELASTYDSPMNEVVLLHLSWK